jgi:hypothetical protein
MPGHVLDTYLHKDGMVGNDDPLGDRIASEQQRGSVLTYTQSYTDDQNERVIEVPAQGGLERILTRHQWASLGDLIWMPDGLGLIAVVQEGHREPSQI